MSAIRTRWAAIGAAVAVVLGAGGIGLVSATTPSGAATFVAITPCRVIDTRPAFNVGPKTSPLGVGEIHTVKTHGSNGKCTGIPDDAIAVSMNMTAVDATADTFLTVWAAGADQPTASSMNPSPGAPPTPNAVTTEVNGAGEFNIFNLAGNVHVLADINGYYVDHRHDDRYYTKSQTNQRIADAIDGQPWSVFVAPTDMYNSSGTWPLATFGNGVTAYGTAFNDGVFGRVSYGVRLPDNYVAGTDVAVDMRYLAVSGFGVPVFPCESVWWSNGPFVQRPGAATFLADTTWETPRGLDHTTTRLPSTQALFDANTISETTMTIDGTDLVPGDELMLTLNRDADETDDTCEGMMVTGLLVRSAD